MFQGDVESIAQKAPKDLTGLFEQVKSVCVCICLYVQGERRRDRPCRHHTHPTHTLSLTQISGSEELKQAYEEARRAKDEADDAVIFAYQKKKSQVGWAR